MAPTQESRIPVAPEVARYAEAVVNRLQSLLGDSLLGTYLIGSGSLGGDEPGSSDIDIIAVCATPLALHAKQAIAEALDHRVLPCPARGLEFVLYSKDAVSAPERSPRFELNFNTGAGMTHRFSPGPENEPTHWYVIYLHIAPDHAVPLAGRPRVLGPGRENEPTHWYVIALDIAREHGVPLAGPPARELLARQPRAWVLGAIRDSLSWHSPQEPSTPHNVLNACRAWRHVEEGVWCTKREAAAWARTRLEDPSIIDAALERRRGVPGPGPNAPTVPPPLR